VRQAQNSTVEHWTREDVQNENKILKGRKYTYNVTLRRVRATFAAVEKQ
jgi:hypothetical protein